jgi:gamma-butyrobetaine dioxygenase
MTRTSANSPPRGVAQVRAAPDCLWIDWADGGTAEFASIWLRDNRGEDRDAHSGQRLVDIVDLPACPRIRSACLSGHAVRIEWEAEAEPASFDLAWLAEQAAPCTHAGSQVTMRPWPNDADRRAGRAEPRAARDFDWAAPEELRRDPARRLAWLTRLLEQGMAFMNGMPASAGALLEVMTLVGRVYETNYGAVFDVRSVPQPDNLAYSDLGLGLHTDNPYREPVPGFQALHALLASPEGGDSVFADGFAIAGHLRDSDAESFEILTRTPVPFRYSSTDAELYAERPLICLSCDGNISAVHYNNRSIAPLPVTGRAVTDFYRAYRRFAELLREPRFQLTFGLRTGSLVVFDNRRILHGRTAFSTARHGRVAATDLDPGELRHDDRSGNPGPVRGPRHRRLFRRKRLDDGAWPAGCILRPGRRRAARAGDRGAAARRGPSGRGRPRPARGLDRRCAP